MANETIITRQNETVDMVSHRFYGTTVMTEKILEANYGLAEKGLLLPAGTSITMPTKEKTQEESKPVNLWD